MTKTTYNQGVIEKGVYFQCKCPEGQESIMKESMAASRRHNNQSRMPGVHSSTKGGNRKN